MRQNGQNVSDGVSFPAVNGQQVMNGGRAIQHADSIAELIDEFCVCSIKKQNKNGGGEDEVRNAINHLFISSYTRTDE